MGTIAWLMEQGRDALTALVKDDNVGFWGLLIRNGSARTSVPELAHWRTTLRCKV